MATLKSIFAITLTALVLRAAASGQTAATLSSQSAEVSAGDTISVKVSFNAPDDLPRGLGVYFQLVGGTDQFGLNGSIVPGQKEVVVTGQIPLDVVGGTYKSLSGYLAAPNGYRSGTQFKVNEITLQIRPKAASEQVPSSAVVALSLTQKQFLQTKSAALGGLLDDLVGALNERSAETPDVRRRLVETAEKADSSLIDTQQDYVAALGKTSTLPPIFFDDFHLRYRAYLIHMRANISERAPEVGDIHLVNFRPRLVDQDRSGAPSYHGIFPPDAENLISIMEENIVAYKIVETTGVDTFSMRIASVPAGAEISYARAGEDFETYSSPTDVEKATFPLARWIFRFTKEGCRTEIRKINPFIEEQPDLVVPLSCRQK